MTNAADQAATGASVNAQIIRRYLDTLRRTQYLPPERLLTYQRGLLERLLRHARAHVPFYRDTGRLDVLFRGNEIDWGRWGEIPPLTRGELQRAGEALHSEALTPDHGETWTLSTSGSTGEPVSVVHTQISRSLAWVAILLRDYERHGVDPKRKLAFLENKDPAAFDLKSVERHDCWYPEFGLLGLFGERHDIADTRDVREIIDVIVSLRPEYVRVQPVLLELMRENDLQHRLSGLGIRAITTVGEHISRRSRTLAETHFRSKVLDHYGSVECGRMASSCPHCGRYHIHSEVVLLEVIEDDGTPAPPQTSGRIIATPLYNYAMPLIRYDHADQAEVGQPGGCAVTLPVLDTIIGKERTSFVFADGVAIRPWVPNADVMRNLGAQAYQIAQIADDRCEFRIVPGDMPQSEMRFDEMTKLLRLLWWGGLKIDYRVVPSLPRGKYGKLALFVREIGH